MNSPKTTKLYKSYQGTIEVSVEDNCLYGEILHINGIISYESDMPSGIQKAFETAVDEYLDDCKEAGVEPVRPHSGTFQIRVGSELHKQAAQAASAQGVSLNKWVANVLQTALNTHPAQNEISQWNRHAPSYYSNNYAWRSQ